MSIPDEFGGFCFVVLFFLLLLSMVDLVCFWRFQDQAFQASQSVLRIVETWVKKRWGHQKRNGCVVSVQCCLLLVLWGVSLQMTVSGWPAGSGYPAITFLMWASMTLLSVDVAMLRFLCSLFPFFNSQGSTLFKPNLIAKENGKVKDCCN